MKWSSSSFWLLTQEALLKVHAFKVPFSSPMQSVQDPTTGDGGTAAAAQPDDKMRQGASKVATCLLQGRHNGFSTCLCGKIVQPADAAYAVRLPNAHTTCLAEDAVCCEALAGWRYLVRSHVIRQEGLACFGALARLAELQMVEHQTQDRIYSVKGWSNRKSDSDCLCFSGQRMRAESQAI